MTKITASAETSRLIETLKAVKKERKKKKKVAAKQKKQVSKEDNEVGVEGNNNIIIKEGDYVNIASLLFTKDRDYLIKFNAHKVLPVYWC